MKKKVRIKEQSVKDKERERVRQNKKKEGKNKITGWWRKKKESKEHEKE